MRCAAAGLLLLATTAAAEPLPPDALRRLGAGPSVPEPTVARLIAGGSALVSCSVDRAEVVVLDLASGARRRRALPGARAAGIDPTGRRLSVLCGKPDRVLQIDLASGELERTIALLEPWSYGMIRQLTPSPDGRWLAGWTSRETLLLWDLSTGRQGRLPGLDPGQTAGLAFLPGGRYVAGDFDRTLRIARQADGVTLRRIDAGAGPLRRIVVSADGRALATVTAGVRVWDTGSGRPLGTFPVLPQELSALALSRTGARAVVGFDEGRIEVWDVAGPRRLAAFEGHPGEVLWLGLQGQRVLSSGPTRLRLSALPDGRDLLARPGHQGAVLAVTFLSGGTVATGGADRTVCLWDGTSGRLRATLRGHTDQVCAVAASPDGRLLASGAWGRDVVRLWDVVRGAPARRLAGDAGQVRDLAFSPDGRWLASAERGRMRLWDVADGTVRWQEGTGAEGLLFSADGRWLVAHDSVRVRAWPLRGGRPGVPRTLLSIAPPYPERLTGMAHGPAGWILVSAYVRASRRGALHALELTGVRRGRRQAKSDAGALAAAPGGAWLLAGPIDGVELIEVASGAVRARLPVHTRTLAWSNDGRRAATGLSDGTTLIWDAAETPRCVVLPEDPGRLATTLELAWDSLARDPFAAHLARAILRANAGGAPDFLQRKLVPDDALRTRIAGWTGALGAPQWAARERAAKALAGVRVLAAAQLRAALRVARDPEVRRRLTRLIAPLDGPLLTDAHALRRTRALRILAELDTPAARSAARAIKGGPPQRRGPARR